MRDLVRRLGLHLEHTEGWQLIWYEFTPEPAIACRPTGWLLHPYRLCASVHTDQPSTVEVRLGHYNAADPIY
ncbi:hypothetical protein ACWDV4_22040 [Micromonospora sp. NPDC003197]